MYILTKFEEKLQCLKKPPTLHEVSKFRVVVREYLAKVLKRRSEIISQHVESVATVTFFLAASACNLNKQQFISSLKPFVRCRSIKVSAIRKSKCYSQVKTLLF